MTKIKDLRHFRPGRYLVGTVTNPQKPYRFMAHIVIYMLLFVFLPIILINSKISATSVSEASASEAHAVAWSAPVGKGWEIFLRQFTKDVWGPAIQLTANGRLNLVPCVMSEKKGTMWIFWSSKQNDRYSILSARIDSEMKITVELIDTSMINNMTPTAIVDRVGVVWLVFSSFDGTDEDIFYMRRENDRWSPPLRVNFNDFVPDIQPLLGMDDDGTIWVIWQGFEEDHYRFFSSQWNGEEWESEVPVKDDSHYFDKIWAQLNNAPELPSEITQPEKASIHFKKAAIQSLPLFIQSLLP